MNGIEQELTQMRFAVSFLFASVAALLLAGCGSTKAGPPPLKVSFRKAQIPTQGMVAGANNSSATEPIKVTAVFVLGKDEREERSYLVDRVVKPLDSISIGWVELDGWKLKSGDKLRIQCEGYTDDLAAVVPD